MSLADSQPSLPSADRSGEGGDAVVQIENVAKSFGETRALRGASLTAYAGEIHAIVGENGSGKSTLAKIISGIVRPDSGVILVNGATVGQPRQALKAGVATVFQEVLVAGGASIADNVFMGLHGPWRSHVSRAEKHARAAELMQRLTGQPVDPHEPVDSLSLSGRQWVTIARALVREPKVVIFDESTAALDLDSTARLYSEMQRLRAEGVCVLVVTHRIAELTSFANRATVLRDGADVGVLSGEEIVLERLLTLMTGVESGREANTPDDLTHRRLEHLDLRTPVLVAKQLSVQPADQGSDMQLFRGEIVGIAGLEGHGQAEFVQALCGIRGIVAGELLVDVDGHWQPVDHLRDAAALGVCYVSGDRRREGIFANLNIFENFAMPLYDSSSHHGIIDRARIRRMFAEQADKLGLKAGPAENPINSLSGGNQQKVLIGRVLAQGPRVIVLNDPARGVDIGTKRELYRQLEALAAGGTAVVYLSTELDELVGFCDRVAVFRDGCLFSWLEGDLITSGAILAAMFGHLEAGFDVETAIAGAT